MKPIEQFKLWYSEELSLTKVSIPAACCLSTIGTDGFPNARFVALKGIIENQFIVTGPVSSRKGVEINSNNKVALSFWWPESKKQVRIQGIAIPLSEELSDKYFADRTRDSQIVSIVSDQGKEMIDLQQLIREYKSIEDKFANQTLPRPGNWGGYFIDPVRMEFLEFKESRFHGRLLNEKIEGKWEEKVLQP